MAIYTNKEWDDVHMTKEQIHTCEWILASGLKCVLFSIPNEKYCLTHKAEFADQQAVFDAQRRCECVLASGGQCVEYAADDSKYCPAHRNEYVRTVRTVQGNQRSCEWVLASGIKCVDYATDEGDFCFAHQAEYARNEAHLALKETEASAFDKRTMRAHWLNEAAAIAPAGTHVGELVSVANWIIDGGGGW
jgi:hypothetical protein